jgi:hypothetical protein
MSDDRKAKIRAYKETPLPAGVFRVRNRESGRTFLGSSPNLPGMLNRQRFQLEMGSHPSTSLQADWNAGGEQVLAFEVLDTLPVPEGPSNQAEDLEALKELWRERLEAEGVSFYD